MSKTTTPVTTAKKAYLLYVSVDTVQASRHLYQQAMDEADHSADVCVLFDGEEKEFTLEEFGELLGFKQVYNS